MKSPMQQTLKAMRERGYECEITEHWNPFAKRRVDLMGFCDVLAQAMGECIAIQTTVTGSMSARLEKIKTQTGNKASLWLSVPGHHIVIQGWAKRGPRGKRKEWTLKELEVTSEMLQGG